MRVLYGKLSLCGARGVQADNVKEEQRAPALRLNSQVQTLCSKPTNKQLAATATA